MPHLTRRHCLATLAAACAAPLARAQGKPMKWHPGQYIHVPPRGGMETVQDTLDRIRNIQAARGLQLRYTWADLEPAEGRYSFDRIARDLDLLGRQNKRLHVLLMMKTFAGGARAIPEYLEEKTGRGRSTFSLSVDEKPEAGVRANTGQNAALWEPAVLDRLQAFLTALGRELDAHPALEGVAINETAIGKADISEDQKQQFFRNFAVADRTMRQAFPTTVVIQFVNFPRPAIPILTGHMPDSGVGLGGPDVFLDDKSLREGAYREYPRLAGIVPIAPSVQAENYITVRHKGPRMDIPLEQLYLFAREQLHANYIFWTRPQGRSEIWPNLLDFLKNHPQASALTGGLQTACPRAFGNGCKSA